MASDQQATSPEELGSLKKRVEKSGVVVIAGFGLRQVLRLGSNLILTRLLMPEAFGLMAAAVSVNVLAIMATDIGVASSVIRSKNSDDPEFLRTAWTIRILRNLFIWMIIMMLAGGIALLSATGRVPPESTFADPRLPWVMALAGCQLILGAFSSLNKLTAQRRLHMRRVIALEVSEQVVATFVTITGAFAGFGVWSLVFGILAGSAYNTIATYFLFPGPAMGFCWRRPYAMEILHFGKWLILASFFGFMTNRGDQIIFGLALDKTQFGFYAVATIWITTASTLLQMVARRLFYPAFSEVLRERPHDLPRVYKQARLVVDLGAAVLALGAVFCAKPVLDLIYPENFSDVSLYLQLMAPIIALFPYRLLNNVILASGDSKRFTWITFVTGAATLILVPLAIEFFGVKAGIIAFACVVIAALPTTFRVASSVIKIDWASESRMFVLAIALAAYLLLATPPITPASP